MSTTNVYNSYGTILGTHSNYCIFTRNGTALEWLAGVPTGRRCNIILAWTLALCGTKDQSCFTV